MSSTEYGAYMGTQFIAAVVAGLAVRVVGGHETAAPVASANATPAVDPGGSTPPSGTTPAAARSA